MSGGRRPRERWVPAYDLADVRAAFRGRRFLTTRRVRTHLEHKGLGTETVREVVCVLERSDFHKSQEHLGRPGVWLDIYRPDWGAERWYVKFVADGDAGHYRVLTFCRDGEQH